MRYGLYLLVLVPWVTDYLETGRMPQAGPQVLTEIVLSILLAAGVTVLIHLRRKIEDQEATIERLSDTDVLTGLGNTQCLQVELVREVARTRRMDRPLCCLLMDLDDFRLINDKYGHEKGNHVLKVVAGTIRTVIRQEMDRAFRYWWKGPFVGYQGAGAR